MTCENCKYCINNKCAYYGWTEKSPCKGNGEKTMYEVEVDGGYKIMTAAEYNTWRKQK